MPVKIKIYTVEYFLTEKTCRESLLELIVGREQVLSTFKSQIILRKESQICIISK